MLKANTHVVDRRHGARRALSGRGGKAHRKDTARQRGRGTDEGLFFSVLSEPRHTRAATIDREPIGRSMLCGCTLEHAATQLKGSATRSCKVCGLVEVMSYSTTSSLLGRRTSCFARSIRIIIETFARPDHAHVETNLRQIMDTHGHRFQQGACGQQRGPEVLKGVVNNVPTPPSRNGRERNKWCLQAHNAVVTCR